VGAVAKAGGLISPICECKKVLNFSAPVKLLFSCMTMCDLFLKRVSRCVGVCFASYIYIYSRMGLYIYICLWHGAVYVFRIARVIYLGCPRFWVLEK
jgi:hypothetical protein